jgi:hypothetical protein
MLNIFSSILLYCVLVLVLVLELENEAETEAALRCDTLYASL